MSKYVFSLYKDVDCIFTTLSESRVYKIAEGLQQDPTIWIAVDTLNSWPNDCKVYDWDELDNFKEDFGV